MNLLCFFHFVSDASFLLRFLRVAKFSQLEALNRLEKYLKLLDQLDGVRDTDMSNPRIQANQPISDCNAPTLNPKMSETSDSIGLFARNL